MRIGILYNISDQARTGQHVEKTADAEIPFTIRAVKAIFEKRHTVIPIKFSPDIYSYLNGNNIEILFNMCEGFRDDNLGEAYITALLEQIRIPFTGSNFFTLSLCMDKARTKEVLKYHGLPTPEFQVVRSAQEMDKLSVAFPFPVIVKPLYEDASIGIYQDSVVNDYDSLNRKVAQILKQFSEPVLIEEYIDGRELNVSMIGNGHDLTVLPVAEIVFNLPPSFSRIVCYEAKWVKNSVSYKNTPPTCPAHIEPALLEKIINISKKSFMITGCRDCARVDLRVRRTKSIEETKEPSEEPYIIEINPNPGKYVDSGFVGSARASGLSYEALCYKLLETTMRRHNMDTNRLYAHPAKTGETSMVDVHSSSRRIETEHLYALPVAESHLSKILSWFNDPKIARFMDDPEYIYTEHELHEMFLITEVHDMDLIFLDKHSGAEVGYGAIYDINYKNGSGEISFLIGNAEFLSKGYGNEIVQALVSIFFTHFKLKSLFASVVVENIPSKKALVKAGFKEIGIRRKSHFVDGKYYDEALFDIVADE